MKTITTIVLAAFVSLQVCKADLTDKLIGTWIGGGVSISNGTTLQTSTKSTFKRFQENGLISTAQVKIVGFPTSKGVIRYYDSGKMEGALIQDGKTLAILRGTWAISENSMTSKMKVSGLFPSFTQKSTTILLGNRKMTTASTTSNGVKGTGSARKVN